MMRRRRAAAYTTYANPGFNQSPAWSFGQRMTEEMDTLASNNPFYCKTGTHRCPQGEELLTHLRTRNDKQLDELVKEGRHWKATPGPGAYRTTRTIGDGEPGSDLNLDEANIDQQPIWSIPATRRQRTYHTIGTKVHTRKGPWQHEGRIDVPTSHFNLTPGPDYYFKASTGGLSMFVQSFMGNGEKKFQRRPSTPGLRKDG